MLHVTTGDVGGSYAQARRCSADSRWRANQLAAFIPMYAFATRFSRCQAVEVGKGCLLDGTNIECLGKDMKEDEDPNTCQGNGYAPMCCNSGSGVSLLAYSDVCGLIWI